MPRYDWTRLQSRRQCPLAGSARAARTTRRRTARPFRRRTPAPSSAARIGIPIRRGDARRRRGGTRADSRCRMRVLTRTQSGCAATGGASRARRRPERGGGGWSGSFCSVMDAGVEGWRRERHVLYADAAGSERVGWVDGCAGGDGAWCDDGSGLVGLIAPRRPGPTRRDGLERIGDG